MNRSEIAMLLGAVAARDQRTIGETDVLAWHEDLGDLDFADARAAVSRHFRESTDRLMPAHIRRHVKAIRDERRASAVVHELPPGHTQDDPDREARIERNKAKVHAVMADIAKRRSVPDAPVAELSASERIRQRAVERAVSERTREAS